jgi:O-succinylbenzoic acid--CoA ligase
MFELRIGNTNLSLEDIREQRHPSPFLREHDKQLVDLIRTWDEGQATFEIRTSGATGKPKQIRLHRDQLEASARLTLQVLKISNGDTALLCLDPAHIGGMMMVIRALVGNFRLVAVKPSATPLDALPSNVLINFAAMVPYQLHHSIQNDSLRLQHMKSLLLGGAPVDAALVEKIAHWQTPVFHTFGMTETASHFALKRLNGPTPDQDYHVLPGTTIATDDRGCLVVQGPMTAGEKIITNELVELTGDTTFQWHGRIDDVINTGGIKVYAAEVEHNIRKWLSDQDLDVPVLIFGMPDRQLGERVCLALERSQRLPDTGFIRRTLEKILPRYHAPKTVYLLHEFLYTENGKIRRKDTANRIMQQLNILNQ